MEDEHGYILYAGVLMNFALTLNTFKFHKPNEVKYKNSSLLYTG